MTEISEKKMAKIQSTTTEIFTKVLGVLPDQVQFNIDGPFSARAAYCYRVGCPGCEGHLVVAHQLHGKGIKKSLPPHIHQQVCEQVQTPLVARRIGFI